MVSYTHTAYARKALCGTSRAATFARPCVTRGLVGHTGEHSPGALRPPTDLDDGRLAGFLPRAPVTASPRQAVAAEMNSRSRRQGWRHSRPAPTLHPRDSSGLEEAAAVPPHTHHFELWTVLVQLHRFPHLVLVQLASRWPRPKQVPSHQPRQSLRQLEVHELALRHGDVVELLQAHPLRLFDEQEDEHQGHDVESAEKS